MKLLGPRGPTTGRDTDATERAPRAPWQEPHLPPTPRDRARPIDVADVGFWRVRNPWGRVEACGLGCGLNWLG